MVKNLPDKTGDKGDLSSIPRLKDPLEEGMATHSSILAWKISWTEEFGELQFVGLQTQTRLRGLSTRAPKGNRADV